MSRVFRFSTSAATSLLVSSAIFVPLMKVAVILGLQKMKIHHTLASMYFVPGLVFVLFASLFKSSSDQAFIAAQNKDWLAAASALDQAVSQDPQTFEANNFHYLRGRVAEIQNDWVRAREEFGKAGPGNPLHSLAMWHGLRASVRLHDDASAERLLAGLPRDFPADLKI